MRAWAADSTWAGRAAAAAWQAGPRALLDRACRWSRADLARAGIPAPAWQHGRDLVAVTAGEEPHYALAFSANGHPHSVNLTIYDERFRLTWYPAPDFCEFYDHHADPGETTNLASAPETSERLAALKHELMRRALQTTNPILGRLGAW